MKLGLLGIIIAALFWSFSTVYSLSVATNHHELKDAARAHLVSFQHKGNKSAAPIEGRIIEQTDIDGRRQYYMDVNSVFCGENVCKIDKVRMYWGELGEFQKIELADNVALEKGQAEDFAPEDYAKLDEILRNPKSGLANLHPSELVTDNRGGNAVDAISSATVSIHTDDAVEGAIWTCYTLWHYANGELVQHIQDITAGYYSQDQLISLLQDSDESYRLFALHQFKRQSLFTEGVRRAVFTPSVINDPNLAKAVVEYVAELPAQWFNLEVLGLLQYADDSLLQQLVEWMLQNKMKFANELTLGLVDALAKTDNFQLSSSILRVLFEHQVLSEEVLIKLVSLLEQLSFIQARSIYWLISDYPLPEREMLSVQAFYNQHVNRL